MAMAAAIAPSSRRGQGAAAAGTARATRRRSAPPIAMRAAPTVMGAASGPSAWAVPVVPKHTAERRTSSRAVIAGRLLNNSTLVSRMVCAKGQPGSWPLENGGIEGSTRCGWRGSGENVGQTGRNRVIPTCAPAQRGRLRRNRLEIGDSSDVVSLSAASVEQNARSRPNSTLTALSAVNVEFAEISSARSTLSSLPPPTPPRAPLQCRRSATQRRPKTHEPDANLRRSGLGLPLGLHKRRLPALRKRHVDRIEVPRHDRRWEDRLRLGAHVAREVPRGEVGEREQAHAGVAGDRRRLGGRGVAGLARAGAFVLQERGLVDEEVGLVRVDLDGLARPRVAGDDDAAPRAGRADDLLGLHAVDLLPTLEPAERGALGDAERAGGVRVEAAGPVVLHERVPVRGRAV